MRGNYGLFSWWDVDNNCFVAFSPDYILCPGIGSTHAEAVTALDDEVQEWIRTGHEFGVDVSFAPPTAKEQPSLISEVPAKSPQDIPEKSEQKARNSPLKALREALEAACATSAAYPLDFRVTLDPCIVRIRGDRTLQTACGARDEIMALLCITETSYSTCLDWSSLTAMALHY